MKTPRLRDIADAAGVSITTVSKALNRTKRHEEIGEACAQRVRQLADRMGYVPNRLARCVRSGRSHALGWVLPYALTWDDANRLDGSMPYFDTLMHGVEAAAIEADCMLVLLRPGGGLSALELGLLALRETRVDALVVAGRSYERNPAALDRFADRPLVLADTATQFPCSSVAFDDATAVRLAVAHVADLGHRTVLWLGPAAAKETPLGARGRHFATAIKALGLRGQTCLFEYPNPHGPEEPWESVCDRAQAALSGVTCGGPSGPTAIIGYNDLAALGALRALERAGRRVPRDVSVVGIDNLQAPLTLPSLTTVDHRLFNIGRCAGRLALSLACNPVAAGSSGCVREVVAPALVVRESTGLVA